MDVLHDRDNRQWIAIAGKRRVPDYVLDHDPDEKRAEDIEDELFADYGGRMFPITNKAATWLSAAYFSENRGSIKSAERAESIERAIKTAASVYNIDADVDEALTPVEIKQASIVDDYAYVDASGRGYYPVHDEKTAELAKEHFDRYHGRYPDVDRVGMARGLMEKLGEVGVEPTAAILGEAGVAMPSRPDLIENLSDRAKRAEDPEAAAIMFNMAKCAAAADSDEFLGMAEKVSEVIGSFDSLAGIDPNSYGISVLSPRASVWSVPMKEAEKSVSHVVVLDKVPFDAEKLADRAGELLKFAGIEYDDATTLKRALSELSGAEKRAVERLVLANCE